MQFSLKIWPAKNDAYVLNLLDKSCQYKLRPKKPKTSMKRTLYLGLDLSQYVADASGSLTHCPIIQIVRRSFDDPTIRTSFASLPDFDHIIFTSKTGVNIFFEWLSHLGISRESLGNKTMIAVGQVTAFHLQKQGAMAHITAQNETAEGVVQALMDMDMSRASFFWPHSANSRRVIPDFFSENRIKFQECILYSTEPLVPETLPNLAQFDEIVFTSPSTVDSFESIFGGFPDSISLISIGPVTNAYLFSRREVVNRS